MFAVECKTGEKNINPSLFYFMEMTQILKFYQVHEGSFLNDSHKDLKAGMNEGLGKNIKVK